MGFVFFDFLCDFVFAEHFGWFDLFLYYPCLLRFCLPGGVNLCNKCYCNSRYLYAR